MATTTDSFIGDGITITDLGGWDLTASIIQQINAKFIITGFNGSNFALARYNDDGSLDITFDGDGKVISNFGWTGGFYGGVAVQQNDGALVIAGTGYNNNDFNLVRYSSDGTLDRTFGKSGTVSTDFGGTELSTALLLQSDAKLVAAGTAAGGLALARYNSDGSLDTSFSTDGKATLNAFSDYIDIAQKIIQQTDSKLVVAGYSRGTTDTAVLVRFNKEGSLDTSFDSDGSMLSFFAGSSHANAVAQQIDGKLLVAGHSNGDVALARFNEDGSIDKSFNNGAVVLTDFGNTEDSATDITIQSDGKLVVVGRSGADIAVARYNNDGSLDKTFHAGGTIITDLGGEDTASSVVIQASDGRIVVAGSSNGDFAVVRYNSDGSLDDMKNNTPTGTVIISNLNPMQGQTLIASNDLVDLDGFTSLRYQWQSGDLLLGTEQNYVLTAADIDRTINVIASYVDNRGNAESVSSVATAPVLKESIAAGISITPEAGELGYNITGENGTLAEYDVVLTKQPTQEVTITFSSSDSTEGIIKTPSLTFNTDNWNQKQTLLVQGVDDYLDDGNINYNITAMIESRDVDYAAIVIAPLVLANNNDARDAPLKLIGKSGVVNDMAGMDGPDYMKGGNLGDNMLGGIGKDSLFGGKGDDVLFGEEGNDKLNGDQGNDIINGGIGDDNLNGGANSDSLGGNDGNDTLNGGDGADTLVGGIGNDIYYIGYDVLDTVLDAGSASDIDTIIMPYQLGRYQIPTGIKNCNVTAGLQGDVTGNDGDNKIVGNEGNNILNGSAGLDSLHGGVGDDELIGGAGADKLYGGSGSDSYAVDDSGDVVIESATTSTNATTKIDIDTVNSFINSYTLPANTENLNLSTGAINGTGNSLNNILVGNDSANTLVGGSGIDTLQGGAGGDTYYIDNSNDVIIEDATIIAAARNTSQKPVISWGEPVPTDTANSSVTYTLASGVEDLTLTGKENINGTGNELNNILVGNTGINILTGLSGNDTLDAGLGKDFLTGGTGNDTFRFSTTLGSSNLDSLTDFSNTSVNNDRIYLKKTIFSALPSGTLSSTSFKLGSASGDGNDFVIYNKTTGALFYDANGNASGSLVQIAIVGTDDTPHATLSAADFFIY